MLVEEVHGGGDLLANMMSDGRGQCFASLQVLEAWPENWENKAVMVAIGAGDFERVVQPQYVRMSTVGVGCAEMLEDPQFIIDVDVGDEDFEREVGAHVSTRADKPDSRKASVAKLVDDFVALIAVADHVADVDGVEATREVFLDIFDACHAWLAISERRKWFYRHCESWRG